MKKYIFWNIRHQNRNVVLTECLHRYAQGESVWQGLLNLTETIDYCTPAADAQETDINLRLKMFAETGINKIEIFVTDEGDKYQVRSSSGRSFIAATSAEEALQKFVEMMSRNSLQNSRDKLLLL